MKFKYIIFFVICAFCSHVVSAAAVDFPGRKKAKYKHLKWIEIGELHKASLENKIKLIDVRSKLEYDTIHVKDAVHISVADRSFNSELAKFVRSTSGKKIAFY